MVSSSIVVLSGCGSSGVPDCGDQEVTDLVKQIANEKLKDNFATRFSPYAQGMTYQALKKGVADGADFLESALQKTEEAAGSIELSLSGIRTQSKNNEIKKSECAAQLDMVGDKGTNSVSFTYDAQYSDNGDEIFVEAYGL